MTRNPNSSALTWRNGLFVIPVVAVFLLLLAPAIYYSLNTPFALVDDLGDSTSVDFLRFPHTFFNWLNSTFWGASQVGRYRPLFDLHNALAWFVAGPHPAYHHLVRWVEWAVGLWLWNLALWRMIRMRLYGWALRASDTAGFMPLLIFNTFVCFFPNQPVARLGPQELHTFCVLGLLFLGAVRLLTDPEDAGRGAVVIRTCAMIAGYVGLSLAKEVNVALMAVYCLFLAGVALTRKRRYLLASVFPAIALLLYTLWRIRVASQSAHYAQLELDFPLVIRNLGWLTEDAFQYAVSPVFAVVIAGSFIAMGVRLFRLWVRYGLSLDVECLLFSLGITLGLGAVLMISWQPVLRYFYPLVPLLGWHVARAYLEGDRLLGAHGVRKKILYVVCLLLLGWFVLANYYGYLLQFAVQHHARNIEQRLLSNMEQRLKAGQPVAVYCHAKDPELELPMAVKVHFEHYLPLYRGETLGLRTVTSLQSGGPLVLATRRRLDPGHWRLLETITHPRDYVILDVAEWVSAKAQGRRRPRAVQDPGTHGFDYAWFIFSSDTEAR